MKQIHLAEAAAFLRQHDHYLVLSHRRPDGDTIGSCAALCLGLRALGKRAYVYANPQFTPKFAPYLQGLIGAPQAAPTIISADISTRELLPFGMEQAEVALAIDHHSRNTPFALLTLEEPEKAACGEIIWALLEQMDVPITPAMGEAVYVAVSTDTGCFRHGNTTGNSFLVAAGCANAGADIYAINRTMFCLKRKARLQLEAHLVQTMEFYAGGKVSVSVISPALEQELGLTEDDLDDIAGFGRTIEGVEIAVLLREVEDGAGKVSLRTSPAFDAAVICSRFGGGGHAAAAGGTVPGGIPAAKEAVLRAIGENITL